MSKKNYQAIAAALNEVKGVDHREAWAVIVNALADVLAASNPRFDRSRFIEACKTGTCKGMPRKAVA
jgi:hypothetical protein